MKSTNSDRRSSVIMKKLISKITSVILAAALLIIPATGSSASAEGTPTISVSEAEAAVNWARGQIGSSKYHTDCPLFVRDSFYYGADYSYWKVDGNARTLADRWIVSDRDDNIPIGAVVFYDYYADLGDGVYNYGHIGLYSGNGMVISALSTVTEHSLHGLTNCRYVGWGTYRGYNMEYDHGMHGVSISGKKKVYKGDAISFAWGVMDPKHSLNYYWLVLQNAETGEILHEGSVSSATNKITYTDQLEPGEYYFSVYAHPNASPTDAYLHFKFTVKPERKGIFRFIF